jgi:hypothetical protein
VAAVAVLAVEQRDITLDQLRRPDRSQGRGRSRVDGFLEQRLFTEGQDAKAGEARAAMAELAAAFGDDDLNVSVRIAP